MDVEAKKQALETLRLGFIGLMHIVMNTKSAQIQKQQALLRFDEGHMWLQNGIMSFEEQPAPQPTTDAVAVPMPANAEPSNEHHAIAEGSEVQQPQEQIAVA